MVMDVSRSSGMVLSTASLRGPNSSFNAVVLVESRFKVFIALCMITLGVCLLLFIFIYYYLFLLLIIMITLCVCMITLCVLHWVCVKRYVCMITWGVNTYMCVCE